MWRAPAARRPQRPASEPDSDSDADSSEETEETESGSSSSSSSSPSDSSSDSEEEQRNSRDNRGKQQKEFQKQNDSEQGKKGKPVFAIVDFGLRNSKDEQKALQFIKSKGVIPAKHAFEFMKLWVQFNNADSLNRLFDLNGVEYEGNPIYVSRCNIKYKSAGKYIAFFKNNYNAATKTMNLSNSKERNLGLNLTADVELEYALWLLGTWSRGRNPVDTLDFSGNGMSHLPVPGRVKVYLPHLKTIQVAENNIMHEEIAKFQAESGVSVVTGDQDEDNLMKDMLVWDRPIRTEAPPTPAVRMFRDTGVPSVEDFVRELIQTTNDNLSSVGQFYDAKAVFSMCFDYLQDLPRETNTCCDNWKTIIKKGWDLRIYSGKEGIVKAQQRAFTGGISMRCEDVIVTPVMGLFYAATAKGTIQLGEFSGVFARAMVVASKGKNLMLLNDSITLMNG